MDEDELNVQMSRGIEAMREEVAALGSPALSEHFRYVVGDEAAEERCMRACMHAYLHTYIHTYIHACIYQGMWWATRQRRRDACVHACIHTCTDTYIHTCMHISRYVVDDEASEKCADSLTYPVMC